MIYKLYFVDLCEPNMIYDTNFVSKQANLIKDENVLNKIKNWEIKKSDSSNPIISTNPIESYEMAKSEDSENNMITIKVKSHRENTHLRKDVIHKSIIRAFNKFYIKCFRTKLNYEGKTLNSLYTYLSQQVKTKIVSSASYQEYFGITNEESDDSKFIKVFSKISKIKQS